MKPLKILNKRPCSRRNVAGHSAHLAEKQKIGSCCKNNKACSSTILGSVYATRPQISQKANSMISTIKINLLNNRTFQFKMRKSNKVLLAWDTWSRNSKFIMVFMTKKTIKIDLNLRMLTLIDSISKYHNRSKLHPRSKMSFSLQWSTQHIWTLTKNTSNSKLWASKMKNWKITKNEGNNRIMTLIVPLNRIIEKGILKVRLRNLRNIRFTVCLASQAFTMVFQFNLIMSMRLQITCYQTYSSFEFSEWRSPLAQPIHQNLFWKLYWNNCYWIIQWN